MMVDVAAGEIKKLTPRRHHVVHGWIDKKTFDAYEAEAQRRRVHTDFLIAEVLSKAAQMQLVAKILDT